MARGPEMLRRRRDFAAVQASGATRGHRLLLVRFLRTDLDRPRFGLSTGRRLGGAVVRNRTRRRLREALRALEPRLNAGWDVLVVVRPVAATASYAEVRAALEKVLRATGIMEGTEQDR